MLVASRNCAAGGDREEHEQKRGERCAGQGQDASKRNRRGAREFPSAAPLTRDCSVAVPGAEQEDHYQGAKANLTGGEARVAERCQH